MEDSSKRYYCHECGNNFVVSNRAEPSCSNCNSEFVELLDTEEGRTVGGNTSLTSSQAQGSSTTPLDTTPLSVTPTSAATRTTTTTSSRNPPINITIGSNPIFRRGLGMPFDPFTAGGGGMERRESPMETDTVEGEDPGDEVLNTSHLRRRTASQVRTGQPPVDPSVGVFPGGVFMVSGAHHPSLGQMIHQHIANVMSQGENEHTDSPGGGGGDGGNGGGGGGGGGGDHQQAGATPEASSTRGGSGEGPPRNGSGSGNRRTNVHVINFPPVHMTLGSQNAEAQRSATGGANSTNPQQLPFNFFGLPFGQLMGMHGAPSDYAWGPQGLDNIISQMLANLEDNGAPPTEKERIEKLPSVLVAVEDLRECILCSVCKEDFTVGETLVKLPCKHLYHRDCVLPWLEMHDTCPTCRFHLNTEKYDERTPT